MAPAALTTAARNSPPRRSALSMALREFRLQRLDRLQDEWVHPAEGREVQAHVVAEVQRPEHPAHEGRSLIVDLLDLRLAGHAGHRDVELASEFGRFISR